MSVNKGRFGYPNPARSVGDKRFSVPLNRFSMAAGTVAGVRKLYLADLVA